MAVGIKPEDMWFSFDGKLWALPIPVNSYWATAFYVKLLTISCSIIRYELELGMVKMHFSLSLYYHVVCVLSKYTVVINYSH